MDAIGGSRFSIGYDVYDGDDLAARARTGLVPFDLASNALRRLTAEERDLLGRAPRACGASAAGAEGRRSGRSSSLSADGALVRPRLVRPCQQRQVLRLRPGSQDQPREQHSWLGARGGLDGRPPGPGVPQADRLPDRSRTRWARAVSAIGNRSFTLAAEIRDPESSTVFATARTVVVGESPLTDDQRSALGRWVPRV